MSKTQLKRWLKGRSAKHDGLSSLLNTGVRHERITSILQELHWLPITKRVQFKVLVYTFKALHNEAPI